MASSIPWITFSSSSSDAAYNVEEVSYDAIHNAMQDYIDSLLVPKEYDYQPFPANVVQHDDAESTLYGSFPSSTATTPPLASDVEEAGSSPRSPTNGFDTISTEEGQGTDNDSRDGDFTLEQPVRKPKTRASLVPSSVATQQHIVKNGQQIWSGVVNAARAESDPFLSILDDVVDHVSHCKTVIGIFPFAATSDQRLRCLADCEMGASRWMPIDRCEAILKTRDSLVRHIKAVHLADIERGDADTREWLQRQRATLAAHQANAGGNQGTTMQPNAQGTASTSSNGEAGPSRRVRTKTRGAKPY